MGNQPAENGYHISPAMSDPGDQFSDLDLCRTPSCQRGNSARVELSSNIPLFSHDCSFWESFSMAHLLPLSRAHERRPNGAWLRHSRFVLGRCPTQDETRGDQAAIFSPVC